MEVNLTDWLGENGWAIWLSLAFLLGIAEVLSLDLVLIMLAVGCLAGAAVAVGEEGQVGGDGQYLFGEVAALPGGEGGHDASSRPAATADSSRAASVARILRSAFWTVWYE